jgi:hypothetical protein
VDRRQRRRRSGTGGGGRRPGIHGPGLGAGRVPGDAGAASDQSADLPGGGPAQQRGARLPRWAVVAATTGSLVRGQGAASAAKATDAGIYTVTFDRDVSACSIQATQGDGGTTPITTTAVITAWRSATDAKVVTVRTADGTNTVQNTIPFTVSVLC